ncbi:MAG: O-antigen ligase family protein [Lachnospiraceae bacterium]|nr:O-antigen ligase family protein [Lachnospiraceae bacterium]
MKHHSTVKSFKKIGKETTRYEKIFVALSMVFFTVFPFIARVSVMKVTAEEQELFITQNGYINDIALYSKEIAIAAFAAIAVLFFIGERIFVDHPEPFDRSSLSKLKVPLILVAVMTVFATLSLIFSSYKTVAFRGIHTEFEGYLAIISYVIVFVFGLYYMRKEDCVLLFKHFVIAVSLITGILCCIELFVKPLLEFTFVQHLISSEKYRKLAESIESRYFVGQSALMFNNPGFLGGFAALFLPIDIALAVEAKKVSLKVVRSIAAALMCVALYGSASKASWIAVVIGVVFMIAFMIRRAVRTGSKGDIINTVVLLGICVVMFGLTSVLVDIKTSDTITYESGPAAAENDLFRLDEATLKDGVIEFKSGDDTLVCSIDSYKYYEHINGSYSDVSFVDCIVISDGEKIIEGRKDSFYENQRLDIHLVGITPDDERFDMITIATEGRMVYFCFGYDGPAQFAMTSTGFKSFAQGDILEDTITQPAVKGLEAIYSFGTGRGYIWAQSLPVIAGSLFVGKGCGNFPFYFRQNEIVGLLNTHGSMKYVIDRPHNWYIQVLVSNGLPYLLCMIVLFAITLLRGGKLAVKRELGLFETGLLAGVLAFMIAGLINDSCITVNPIFWLVFGVTVRRVMVTQKSE